MQEAFYATNTAALTMAGSPPVRNSLAETTTTTAVAASSMHHGATGQPATVAAALSGTPSVALAPAAGVVAASSAAGPCGLCPPEPSPVPLALVPSPRGSTDDPVWAPLLDVSRPATAIATPAQADVLAEPDCKFSELAVPAVAEVADALGQGTTHAAALAGQIAGIPQHVATTPASGAAVADAANGNDQAACVRAADIATTKARSAANPPASPAVTPAASAATPRGPSNTRSSLPSRGETSDTDRLDATQVGLPPAGPYVTFAPAPAPLGDHHVQEAAAMATPQTARGSMWDTATTEEALARAAVRVQYKRQQNSGTCSGWGREGAHVMNESDAKPIQTGSAHRQKMMPCEICDGRP